MTAKEIYNQITKITSSLIAHSLCDEQYYPSLKDGVIYISDRTDLSIALKNIPYREIYKVLFEQKNYNIKMIDGALIQLMYTFEGDSLKKHRLSFFPSPFLLEYQSSPEIYQEDLIYADIVGKNVVPTPIRVDYDPDNFEALHHSRTHLTIGQYSHCRIPVSNPLSPAAFMDFIIRNFYHTDSIRWIDVLNFGALNGFSNSLASGEEKILHFSIK